MKTSLTAKWRGSPQVSAYSARTLSLMTNWPSMPTERRRILSGSEVWDVVMDKKLPPIVIAELSANHLGSLARAKELIREAANAGADAVKFQHYSPQTITVRSTRPEFFIGGDSPWAGRDLWSLYEEAMTPWEWTRDLIDTCEQFGIAWFSSPFDETAVDFLEQFHPPMYKVASFELIDIPLVRRIAETGKPMILSTGMSSADEISEAIATVRSAGLNEIVLLRTNSAYPAPTDQMDLLAVPFMSEKWNVTVGLSDHTLENTAAIVATALGARVFEKHLTLKRADGGADAAFSLEPSEFIEYVRLIRDAHASLGNPRLGPSAREEGSLQFRPSIRATKEIAAGEAFSMENIATVRPAGGLHPRHLPELIGRKCLRVVSQGEPLTWDLVGDN